MLANKIGNLPKKKRNISLYFKDVLLFHKLLCSVQKLLEEKENL